jgi:hypothetical protein
MRWLAMQGMSPEEIREARWGMVDETDRTISVHASLLRTCYNRDTGVISTTRSDGHTVKLLINGSGLEWFFLESKISCAWMFTKKKPKTWRKQGSKEALFSVEAVEKICSDLTPVNATSVLTKRDPFARIRVSKLNITNPKSVERVRE